MLINENQNIREIFLHIYLALTVKLFVKQLLGVLFNPLNPISDLH